MKIGYTTYFDAKDIGAWSGTIYHIGKNFEKQGFEVEYIDKLKKFSHYLFRYKSLYYKLINKQYHRIREPFINKNIARQIEKKIKIINPDIIFSADALPVSCLECKQPIVFWSDATFAGMLNFYYCYFNLNKKTIENGMMLEQSAYDRAKLILFSSDWAAQTAIDNFKVDKNKIHVVPFGANIETEFTYEEMKSIILSRNNNIIKILFVGVDWIRKGGDILIQVVRELIKLGFKIELNIIGTNPELREEDYKFTNVHGFLRKWVPEENKKIIDLFKNSHIFIMPTRAEAYGIVFCEANAFGLPVIGPDTGGVPTIIKDGINGYLINHEKPVESIVKLFSSIFSDSKKYTELSLSSFNEYQKRLNWKASILKVRELLNQIVN
ncbi:MAG: glycosyltransferase [Bacteroidetes bacterium]|nr:MAG: glycosyltransferase [Bacteroidota bacterium]